MSTRLTVNMTDLARRLGVQVHQVHYLVQTGRIPPGRKRDKFRLYTEEQAETIEQWYRQYMRLDAGCCGDDEYPGPVLVR
jgi:DNA-binding transcriptional MerR regulator